MNRRKGCILTLLLLGLIVSGGMAILLLQQRQAVQPSVIFYKKILAQAPCIEYVCPGFVAGRVVALERLVQSELVQGVEQEPNRIGLTFTQSEGSAGYGIIEFITDTQGTATMVDHISLVLFDLNLETVLSTLGEPDQFLFISGCGIGRRVNAELYYPDQSIMVLIEHPMGRIGSPVLAKNTPIQAIIYLQPSNFQDQLVESIQGFIDPANVAYNLRPSITADDILAQIQPWPGIDAAPTPSADYCPR